MYIPRAAPTNVAAKPKFTLYKAPVIVPAAIYSISDVLPLYTDNVVVMVLKFNK